MKSVFISHAQSDVATVDMIADLLNREEISVHRADRLVSGTDWQAEILSRIRQCDVFIAIIDQPTSSVMVELGYALGTAKQVLLVGGRDVQIPFDVASLPVVRVDSHDPRSIFQIVDKIRGAVSKEVPPIQEFAGARDRLEHMLHDPNYLEQFTPREFESSVAEFLSELEFDVVQMPMAHDGGYDILVKGPGSAVQSILVEVKKYTRTSKLGVAAVRQLLGSTMVNRASCGILVTTSEFSVSARSLAERAPVPIVLLTLEDLVASTRESITTACS